jgi:muramoyltetrapeptide carboxypeptidase
MSSQPTQLPPFLQAGDTIGIVAPARKVSEEEMQPAIQWLTKEGFQVLQGEHLYADNNQFAGYDSERTKDFQAMLDNPEVKAILCARGGYGSVRIIDRLNFSNFMQNPKWICGFSDITVFHSHVHRHCHIATLHSTLAINIPQNTPAANNSFLTTLRGKPLTFSGPSHPLDHPGEATAEIIGGNLSMLYSLLGSNSDIDTEGKILFIEDLDEYLYHIDRMMMNLKRNGKLEHLAGLVIGAMSDMHDNTIPFGKTAEEIVAEHCANYNYPVGFGFPAGHIKDNRTFILGGKVRLEVHDTNSVLTYNIQ